MASEIKSLTDEALVQGLASRERDLVRARFDHSMQSLENTATLSQIRKEIARYKTEARSREIAQGLRKGQLEAQFRKGFGKAGGVSPESQQAPTEKGGFLKGIVDRLTAKE